MIVISDEGLYLGFEIARRGIVTLAKNRRLLNRTRSPKDGTSKRGRHYHGRIHRTEIEHVIWSELAHAAHLQLGSACPPHYVGYRARGARGWRRVVGCGVIYRQSGLEETSCYACGDAVSGGAGFLEGPVEQLCGLLDEWRINWELRELPPEVWDFVKANRFFGMIIPKANGGLGFSSFAHSEVIRKISTRSITAAVTVMVPNSLGPGELLLRFGTNEQQDYWLPRLADGREIPWRLVRTPRR